MTENTLYYGDNLDVMRRYVDDESVDLVYLDPPFNSSRNYNVLFEERDGSRAAAQIQAFEDTWQWDASASAAYHEVVEGGGKVSEVLQAFRLSLGDNDMLAYLSMMAPRLIELKRVMRETAPIYLHCDPTASAHLRLLMDAVFNPDNFRGEIIWRRTNARSTTGSWPRVHDTILFYSKSDAFHFTPLKQPAEKAKMPHTLVTGAGGVKYQSFELTAPGHTQEGESGQPWRGFNPAKWGRPWANTKATMDAWDAVGLIHWPSKGGFPCRRDEKPFDPESRTITVGDVWTDIDRINQSAKERLGYPTQKPVELLERILEASSKEGDVVVDPFCGCGTTIAAAEKLKRRWIGIDITHLAIGIIRTRLHDSYGDTVKFRVIGEPTTIEDAEELANTDPYQFQWWALGLVGARRAEQKKGADKGIDGRLYFHDGTNKGKTNQIILSVKAGKLHAPYVRDLRGVVEREKAQIGVLLALDEPTKQMRAEAASAGFYESPWGKHPRLQILTVGELLDGRGIDYPRTSGVNQTFKRAPKTRKDDSKNQFSFEDQ